jgi:hypothetical protein
MIQRKLSAIVTLAACVLCAAPVHAGGIFIQHKEVTPRPDPRAPDDPKLPRVLVVGDSIPTLDKPAKNLPLPGETFAVEGRSAFLMLPKRRDVSKPIPWVWYAPTLPNLS